MAAMFDRLRAEDFSLQLFGVMRLRLLQGMARRTLTDRHGVGFWLNRRDPMRLFVDRPDLDEVIDRMFGGVTA